MLFQALLPAMDMDFMGKEAHMVFTEKVRLELLEVVQ
jgi:hypothetical protein